MRRIAVVHDWLTVYAGAERVLEQILQMYPAADLYCVCDFLPPAVRGFLRGRTPTPTFVQNVPFARKFYRHYLPLMPLAIEQLDLTGYDVIISSSHAVAKGVIRGPEQLHVSYVHSPMRYAWDLQHQYLGAAGLERGLRSWMARYFLHRMRLWDHHTANGVDAFVANSHFVARRIWNVYRRAAQVVHPPVDVDAFPLHSEKRDYYLAASRLVPYKRIDLAVEAFARMPNRRLIVVGEGPQYSHLRRMAHGYNNIEVLGYQPAPRLATLMGEAAAFIFPSKEDFGIMPLEAQACGTPVLAFGAGGATETIRGPGTPAPTGDFFEEQTSEALIAAVERFERGTKDIISAENCRANAGRFTKACFRATFAALMDREWADFSSRLRVLEP